MCTRALSGAVTPNGSQRGEEKGSPGLEALPVSSATTLKTAKLSSVSGVGTGYPNITFCLALPCLASRQGFDMVFLGLQHGALVVTL